MFLSKLRSLSSFLFPRKPRLASERGSDLTIKSAAGVNEAQTVGPVAMLQTAVSPGGSVL